MYRTALARKHRPRRFGELVGQDHVASTLRAAVEGGRTAHAYLFCGPRGIGKTTVARVLAMALNCPRRKGGEPCGTCESCERIWAGRTSFDVVEIDAASNRGVDDARDLRQRAMYAPSDENRYKVYIIDEAHMLTREAWNALLKVLEEPPPRVVFAFATTEPHKIQQSAAPVISRCQRFDFRRVTVADLIGRLRQVLAIEGVEAEDRALLAIARRAEGGVRDALSLLDQVLSFSGDRVRLDDVRRMLGLVEEERYLELFGILARGDRAAVFGFVQTLLDDGVDLGEFTRGLGEALRMLLALRIDPEGAPVELLDETRGKFVEAAAGFSETDLLRLLVAVADFETTGGMRRSMQPRIQLEVLLLRLASLDSAVALDELLGVVLDGHASGAGEATRSTDRKSARARGSTPARGSTEARGSTPSRPAGATARQGGSPASGENAGPDPATPSAGAPAADTGPAGGAPGLREAWRDAIAAAEGLGGQALVLSGVSVLSLEGGELHLGVPPGLAEDLQRFLDDGQRSASLRGALAARLGTTPAELAFRVQEAGGRRRLTAAAAREQRLAKMVEVDPRLREAVRELDLRLKE